MVFTTSMETFAKTYHKHQNFSPPPTDDLISSAPTGTFDDAEYESRHEGCDVGRGGDIPLPTKYLKRRDEWREKNGHALLTGQCLISEAFTQSEIFRIAREVGAQLVLCSPGRRGVKTYYFKCPKSNPRWTPSTVRSKLVKKYSTGVAYVL